MSKGPARRAAAACLLAVTMGALALPYQGANAANPWQEIAAPDPRVPPTNALDLERVDFRFDSPQGVVAVPDGSSNLLVLERDGRITLVRADGDVARRPFLDLREVVEARETEQGLFSLAFHPAYRENGFFYVHYSRRGEEWASVVERYTISEDPEEADASTATVILDKEQPNASHFGGQLAFGPDGMLWIAFGDGGLPPRTSATRASDRAQDLSHLLGKILRIDVDGGDPYAIPADNPFVGVEGARPEIWAYGLRNPWRFSFDRLTGDLYVADVGQAQYEEVNFVPAGSPGGMNFGWSQMEGAHCFNERNCDPSLYTLPVVEYSHERMRVGCAVTGGYVYRGNRLPGLYGAYLYGDFCTGRIWSLWRDEGGSWQTELLVQSGRQVTSFAEDEAGELYLTDIRGGLYRVVAAEPRESAEEEQPAGTVQDGPPSP